ADRCDDVDVGLGAEQLDEAGADDRMILREQEPDHRSGNDRATTVPRPGSESIRNVPSTSAARSRSRSVPMWPSPPAAAGSNPLPSSVTVSTEAPPERSRVTETCSAPECFWALRTASP